MKTILSIALLFCSTLLSFSQRTISGKILDIKEQTPLISATIIALEDQQIGTITDVDGKFMLSISEQVQTLSVSYTGYQTQKITLDGRTNMEVQPISSTSMPSPMSEEPPNGSTIQIKMATSISFAWQKCI